MKSKKLILILCTILPFLLGTSKNPNPDDNFSLSSNSVTPPGTNANVILYSSDNRNRSEFTFRLFKLVDLKGFYKTIMLEDYRFDVIAKESIFNYTKIIKEWKSAPTELINLGVINEPGTYILQAVRGKKVAYCPVIVTKYAFVYRATSTQVLSYLQDYTTGRIANDANFTLLRNKKEYTGSVSDGISMIKIDTANRAADYNRDLLFAELNDEVLVNKPNFYYNTGDKEIAYTYTNQPVYRPGQKVYFKSIIRSISGNDYVNLPGVTCNVTIKSPQYSEIYSTDLTTNETGTLSGDFTLNPEAELGNYSIIITRGGNTFSASFSVEEYKKPEYEVTVNLPKNNYSNGDKIEGKVTAKYYFGSPVTKGDVTLRVFRNYYWRPWWYFSEYSWFYRGFQKSSIREMGNLQLINTIEGKLDANGEYTFSFEVNEKEEMDYVYAFDAQVTDQSRRAISGSASAYITRGSFSLSASTESYFSELGKPVLFRINAVDFSDKLVETGFKIKISYQKDYYWQRENQPAVIDSLTGKTDNSGEARILYMPRLQQSGYYSFTVSAKDEKGRVITASGNFYYGNNSYYYYDYGQGVQIITDKDTYKKGDTLSAIIFLPDSSLDVVVCYESNEIFSFRKYSPSVNKITIKEVLTEKFAPSFSINITYAKNGRFQNSSKVIGVLDEDKMLNISVKTDKKQYKPGDQASYLLTALNKKGRPVPGADLSVGIIDESIYAIHEDDSQEIGSYFYSTKYRYIETNSSVHRYTYSYSRNLTGIDLYATGTKENTRKGNGNLSGTLKDDMSKDNERYFETIKVYLYSKDDLYIAQVDSKGRYKFTDIPRESYYIIVFKNDAAIYAAEEPVQVTKRSTYDITLNQYDNSVNTTGGNMLNAPRAAFDMAEMKSSKQEKSTINFKEAVVRSNFTDAAFWKATLITDSKGQAVANFKMPDNLTTWRTTVKGVTASTIVGQAVNKTITRKDLLVRMETPRFFQEGDELTVSTIVHNYLDKKKRTRISFKSDNLKITSSQINTPGYSTNLYNSKENMYELDIDKNTELRIDWRVSVNAPFLNTRLTAEALTDQESDAMQVDVPVLPKGIKQTSPLSAELENQQEETVKFNIPEGIDLRSARVQFNVTPSLAGSMLKAIDELAGYPYGCVEQTMSRFLPTLIVSNAFTEIKAPLKSTTITELPKMIDAGIKRLYSLQHEDGGWGWWKNDESNSHMTAYVVYGLALSRNAGYNIDNSALQRGEEKIVNALKSSKDDETSLAYMIYALSTSAPDKYKELLHKKIGDMNLSSKKLNPYSVSLLILSAVNMKEDKSFVDLLVKQLRDASVTNGGFITWKGKEWHYSWRDDEVQTTAFAVKALLNAGYKDVGTSVKWLLLQRKGFAWRSTQETASILYALTDYLKVSDELKPDYKIKVFVNNQLQLEKSYTANDVYTQPVVTEVLKGLNKGSNEIRIVKSGKGKAYFSGLSEYFSQDINASGKNKFFNVTREYYILKPIQQEDRIIYRKENINRAILSGEDVFVKTKVTSSTSGLQYFMLEDMLPSGFEVVKEEKMYEIEGENNYRHYGFYDYNPWRWFYADKDYRDEKVAFFVTYPQQEMEFSYIIKAQIPGKYTSMPAQASLMYYPEFNGNSGAAKFVVKDK